MRANAAASIRFRSPRVSGRCRLTTSASASSASQRAPARPPHPPPATARCRSRRQPSATSTGASSARDRAIADQPDRAPAQLAEAVLQQRIERHTPARSVGVEPRQPPQRRQHQQPASARRPRARWCRAGCTPECRARARPRGRSCSRRRRSSGSASASAPPRSSPRCSASARATARRSPAARASSRVVIVGADRDPQPGTAASRAARSGPRVVEQDVHHRPAAVQCRAGQQENGTANERK